MISTLAEQVAFTFGLTEAQRRAALERGRDIVVTAGAGSGKTRTLVARYASLLADGLEPRRVVAVTFTEKAAREMRSRVREAISKLIQNAKATTERQMWLSLSSRLDSARIGTIHSLCAEILRAHPAEAGIDPRFNVLDEGLTSALRAQVIDDTLSGFVENPSFDLLFARMKTQEIRELLDFLIEHRYDASETFASQSSSQDVVKKYLTDILQYPAIADPIGDLRSMSRADLETDKLYERVSEILGLWSNAEQALREGQIIACAQSLYTARRSHIRLDRGKKDCRTKDILRDLKDAFDEFLDPIVGGKVAQEFSGDESETNLLLLTPLIEAAFGQLVQNYRQALDQQQAMDFDDLEAGAERLLSQPAIRERWQSELDALLVDEFQDTNARQHKIVAFLAGNAGRLFVVGDDRQSIYRFRRADVTVFRSIREQVEKADGLVLDLDRTYRAHEPLLQAAGDILSSIMGTTNDPTQPYYVPFSQLDAYRKEPLLHMQAPHIEIVVGAGNDASDARPIMARSLARRLLELKEEKQIRNWDDVVLLFRAASGYPFYEDAFEEMEIPFVTVAGRGFYERPEIRDVLNILHALTDPMDDLAMAGLLRSPAFGLTDSALYLLRQQAEGPVSYWNALQGDFTFLGAKDQEKVRRTADILNSLLSQVDRNPVAELLKQLIDLTDYRAILAAETENATGGRLWRNLDKLLNDAYTSGHVNVRNFLDYLSTLSDAGAREGEAPTDAQGAVRLMTIHKSKGLEFPIVVLADAGRERRSSTEQAYLLPDIGFAVKSQPPSLHYSLAKWQDGLQNIAEAKRILYVALTRAKEKLIISGHTNPTPKQEWKAPEWEGDILAAAQIDMNELVNHAGTAVMSQTVSAHPVRAVAFQEDVQVQLPTLSAEQQTEDASPAIALFRPLAATEPRAVTHDEQDDIHPWRATGKTAHVPAGVVGQIVHKAIELWLFPDDPRFIDALEIFALDFGLATIEQRSGAVQRARELLIRLQAHPFWKELSSATQRVHEVPYSYVVEDRAETGYIDLLYQTPEGWQIIDFKTDSIRTAAEREYLTERYLRQMLRYKNAVETLLGQTPSIYVCFLDDCESVNVIGWI